MKPFLFAAASLVFIAPEALARDLIRVGTPVDHSSLFLPSGAWHAPDLLGGPAARSASQMGIIPIDPGQATSRSGIRIFRGGSVTQADMTRAASPDPALSGRTITRIKKRPRNPYKTVIVYTPQSVREVRTRRNPD